MYPPINPSVRRPDNLPATNGRWDSNEWLMSLQADANELLYGLNIILSSVRRYVNRGYHGWVGHIGTTSTPTTWWLIIFRNVRKITAKGEKA